MQKDDRQIPPKVSDEVMEIFNNSCAFCGDPFIDRHHIYPYALGGSSKDSKNIVPLCSSHHTMAHTKIRKTGKPMLEEVDINLSLPFKDQSKESFALQIEPGKDYFFKLGSLEFKNCNQILLYEDLPPTIRIYTQKIRTFQTRETFILNLRFFDNAGNWLGSIIGNNWCGLRGKLKYSYNITPGDRTLIISYPSEGTFIQINILNNLIVITGLLKYKDQSIEFGRDTCSFGDTVVFERVRFENLESGVRIDAEGNFNILENYPNGAVHFDKISRKSYANLNGVRFVRNASSFSMIAGGIWDY